MTSEPAKQTANWLQHYVDLAETNGNQLAKKLGVPRQRLSVLLKRESPIPFHWAERLAPLLNVTTVELIHGPNYRQAVDTVDSPSVVAEARFGGQVAAGMWLEDSFIDGAVYDPVPIVLARYPSVPQIAYKVSGPSMDLLRIFDGDYVITVPYWEVRASFQNNDIVVVERRDGHRFERTCKQLQVHKDRIELWPRSSHEAFQTPLVIPIRREEVESGEEIEVIGLVIGRHAVM